MHEYVTNNYMQDFHFPHLTKFSPALSFSQIHTKKPDRVPTTATTARLHES